MVADAAVLRLDPAHQPLSIMLVMTQMSAGGLTMAAVLGGLLQTAAPQTLLITAAAAVGLLGLAVSVLHLGQPLKAWRVFLGWRKSWLSREAMLFGGFGGAAVAAAGQVWLAPSALPTWWLPGVAATVGLAGVAASAMVYIDTRRPFWSAGLVAGKFGGTTLLLGAALAAVVWSWQGAPEARPAALLAWAARLLLSAWEIGVYQSARRQPSCPWHKSALTMHHLQPGLQRARMGLLALTGGLLPTAALLVPTQAPVLLTVALLCTTTSQLLERHQFFTACAGPRMPGLG
jgi:DMSO reductase anchor subunit